MRPVSAIAAIICLAACGSEPSVELRNVSAADVASEVAKSGAGKVDFEPGRWETSVRMVSAEAPGMPPQALDAMKSAFAKATPTASCLTPEEARKPASDFFTGGKSQDCTYERFSLGGGKIDSVMRCGGGANRPGTRLEMQGNYTPASFEATMRSRTDLPGAAAAEVGAMTMTMAVTSRRTGVCTGAEKA